MPARFRGHPRLPGEGEADGPTFLQMGPEGAEGDVQVRSESQEMLDRVFEDVVDSDQ